MTRAGTLAIAGLAAAVLVASGCNREERLAVNDLPLPPAGAPHAP